MKILIFILIIFAPSLLAQIMYRKHVDPNEEPFLPINPIYPYSPKPMKKFPEKETALPLSFDLYAPQPNARDSFTASFSGNPQNNPAVFSGYGGFPRTLPRNPAPPYPPYSPYFGNGLFGLYSNPYAGNPYASGGHGHFNEPPYFYPDYHNHGYNPFHPYPPSPEFLDSRRPMKNKIPSLNGDSNRMSMERQNEKSKPADSKLDEKQETSSDGAQGKKSSEYKNQYIDGNNFISHQDQKEATSMDAQPPLSATNHNDREKMANIHLQMVPQLPPTTYKVISIGGRPVGPNYPLPESYARSKLMEQATAIKNFIESMGGAIPIRQMNEAHQDSRGVTAPDPPQSGPTSEQENSMALPGKEEFHPEEQNPMGSNMNDERYFEMPMPNAAGRPTDAHIYGNDERDLPSQEPPLDNRFARGDEQAFDSQRQQAGGKNFKEPEGGVNKGERNVDQLFVPNNPAVLAQNLALQRYQNLSYYVPKPASASTTTLDRPPSTYILSQENVRPVMEELLEDPASQSQTFGSIPYRLEQNFNHPGRMQPTGNSYRSENLGHTGPQTFTYHPTNSLPASSRPSQQGQAPITDLEDVNYGTNRGNKE